MQGAPSWARAKALGVIDFSNLCDCRTGYRGNRIISQIHINLEFANIYCISSFQTAKRKFLVVIISSFKETFRNKYEPILGNKVRSLLKEWRM